MRRSCRNRIERPKRSSSFKPRPNFSTHRNATSKRWPATKPWRCSILKIYKRHVTLAENAERLRHADLAMRSYLRAGQLTQASSLDEALDYFGRAHRLAPQDKGTALLFAEAKLRKGDAEGAAKLLEPFASTEKSNSFLALYGEALLRTGKLDAAREIFESYFKQKPDTYGKLFELASAYVKAGEDAKAASLLVYLKDALRKQRKDGDLMIQVDKFVAQHPTSLPIAEIVAKMYDEMNRETKYFDALVRLFDLYLPMGQVKEACETLDRLVDIDPYDYRNHERIEKLQGLADPAFLASVMGRAAKAATVSTRTRRVFGRGKRNGRDSDRNARGNPSAAGAGRSGGAGRNFSSVLAAVESQGTARTHRRTFSRRRTKERAARAALRTRELVAQRREKTHAGGGCSVSGRDGASAAAESAATT